MTAVAIRALVRRDAMVAVSYRTVFVLEVFFGVVELVMYFFISRTFADLSESELGAAPSYFGFAVIGILLGAVLIAMSSSVGYRLRDEQVTGTLEALRLRRSRRSRSASGSWAFHSCSPSSGRPSTSSSP